MGGEWCDSNKQIGFEPEMFLATKFFYYFIKREKVKDRNFHVFENANKIINSMIQKINLDSSKGLRPTPLS